MQFEERVDGDVEGRMFRVKSTDPRGPSLTYVCQAEDAQTRARSGSIMPISFVLMSKVKSQKSNVKSQMPMSSLTYVCQAEDAQTRARSVHYPAKY